AGRSGFEPPCFLARYNAEAMFKRAPEQAAASADERPGFVARLRARLNRGASWLSYDLTDLFTGRDIDAAILEELETRLISADVGVEATERILTALRARVARRELTDVGALIGAVRECIVEILTTRRSARQSEEHTS